jgi:putative ABC transport system permease protein
MTATIDGRIETMPSGEPPRLPPRGRPWRFALRLARREVRRRPGRTLLVMLLVAVPVLGMSVVMVFVRTNTDSAAESFARHFGAADLAAGALANPKVATAAGGAAAVPPFPPGTRVVSAHDSTSDVGLQSADGTTRLAEVTDLDLKDPIAHGIALLRSGRFPTRAGEAMLSPSLARAFHVTVGDTLRLHAPSWTEKVVGIGVRATDWNDGFIAVRGNELTTGLEAANEDKITLVDLPGHPSDSQLLAYAPAYQSRAQVSSGTSTKAVNWVLVGGIVALAIVGIVISGAFAVGARRQLVTLGQLSANGADEGLLRLTLSLEGLLSGVIGSVLGFGAGVATLGLMRGHFEGWLHHDPGPYIFSARDIVAVLVTGVIAATVAAFIPARSAAKVPVLSALAGRRPLGTLPKRLVPIGAALFAGGVFVLVLVATASGVGRSNGLALSAVFGGLLVLAGACCASSVVVAALGGVAGKARGAMRVAVRSVVRSRARSAAVVMALAAVNAGAIAVGTALESRTGTKVHNAPFMPDDTLTVSRSSGFFASAPQILPISPEVTTTLHELFPAAQWNTLRRVLGALPGAEGPIPAKLVPVSGAGATGSIARRRDVGTIEPPFVTIADPAVLRMLGLSARDALALQRAGAIAVGSLQGADGTPLTSLQFIVGQAPAQRVDAAVAQDSVRGTGEGGGFFMTEAKARSLHLRIVDAGEIVTNPKPFDESQLASLDVLSREQFTGDPNAAVTDIAWRGTSSRSISPGAVRQIVLGIAVLIALIVLAMSLALSAAETRDERDILVSLGARPSTMRAVSGWKAALLAVSGALVAVPTGFIPVAVVYLAVTHKGEFSHIVFPWSTALQLVLVAPIIAGIVAYIGSAVAQAVRPTRMSTFATD